MAAAINPITADPAAANRRIFVGRLPTSHPGFTPSLLEEVMSQFGEVEAVSCLKGFGFVQFKQESSVGKAFKSPSVSILENRLDIKPAKTNNPPAGAAPPPPPEKPGEKPNPPPGSSGPPGKFQPPGPKGGPSGPGPAVNPPKGGGPPGRSNFGGGFGDDRNYSNEEDNYAEDTMEEGYGDEYDDQGNYNEEGYEDYGEDYYEESEGMPPAEQNFPGPGSKPGPKHGLLFDGRDQPGPVNRPPGPSGPGPLNRPPGPPGPGPMNRPPGPSGPPGPSRPPGPHHRGPRPEWGPRPPLDQNMPFGGREEGPDRNGISGPPGQKRSFPEEPRGRSPPRRERSPPRRDSPPRGRDRSPRDRSGPERKPEREPSPLVNDCEIIATSRSIRPYAEHIEGQLKRQGMRVDVLFPHEDIPIKKVLDELSSRGVVFGVVLLPNNEKHLTMNVHVLQGRIEDHRDVAKEEGLRIIGSIFRRNKEDKRPRSPPRSRTPERDRERDRSVPERKANTGSDMHPHGIQLLLNFLQENRPLTLVEYDKVIKYLLEKREKQIRTEYGEDPAKIASLVAPALPAALIPGAAPLSTTQAELQSRILNFLNSGRVGPNGQYIPPAPVGASAVQPAAQPASSAVFSDPSIQKALDTLIQSGPNLFQTLGQGAVNPGMGMQMGMGQMPQGVTGMGMMPQGAAGMGMMPQGAAGMGMMHQYGHY